MDTPLHVADEGARPSAEPVVALVVADEVVANLIRRLRAGVIEAASRAAATRRDRVIPADELPVKRQSWPAKPAA